jgi:ThiF family protein
MTRAWEQELDAERDRFRRVLAAAGFVTDGEMLRGPLHWHLCNGNPVTATIEVTLIDAFPFSPPQIQIIEAGVPLTPTFHRSRDGSLCLWPDETPVEKAPWRDPTLLLRKVAGWLRQTEAGWPDDAACDLDRYLPVDPRLVLYDLESLATTQGCVRTQANAGDRCVMVTGEIQRPPTRPKRQRARRTNAIGPTIGRKHKHLAWAADIGQVNRPIEDWTSLGRSLGEDARHVGWLISIGAVEFLVLRYRRAAGVGVLALAVRPSPTGGAPIEVRCCEAADTGMTTRMLRAGSAASDLADCRVAVVGTGAVGSFVADLLFRHGVRNLTLLDWQLLRPGNLVRHLAGENLVGYPKAFAVKCRLGDRGFDTTHVDHRHEKLTTPEQAITLLREHHLIIDASADPRATALLIWASSQIPQPVVSVCAERQGAIIRVDRFPRRGAERHLAPVPARGGDLRVEHGCDDPVSLTPPTSVVAAAQLACRVAIDELTGDCTLPATVLDVIEPQEAPYDMRGIKTPAYAAV